MVEIGDMLRKKIYNLTFNTKSIIIKELISYVVDAKESGYFINIDNSILHIFKRERLLIGVPEDLVAINGVEVVKQMFPEYKGDTFEGNQYDSKLEWLNSILKLVTVVHRERRRNIKESKKDSYNEVFNIQLDKKITQLTNTFIKYLPISEHGRVGWYVQISNNLIILFEKSKKTYKDTLVKWYIHEYGNNQSIDNLIDNFTATQTFPIIEYTYKNKFIAVLNSFDIIEQGLANKECFQSLNLFEDSNPILYFLNTKQINPK
jgi:hypothetical protein